MQMQKQQMQGSSLYCSGPFTLRTAREILAVRLGLQPLGDKRGVRSLDTQPYRSLDNPPYSNLDFQAYMIENSQPSIQQAHSSENTQGQLDPERQQWTGLQAQHKSQPHRSQDQTSPNNMASLPASLAYSHHPAEIQPYQLQHTEQVNYSPQSVELQQYSQHTTEKQPYSSQAPGSLPHRLQPLETQPQSQQPSAPGSRSRVFSLLSPRAQGLARQEVARQLGRDSSQGLWVSGLVMQQQSHSTADNQVGKQHQEMLQEKHQDVIQKHHLPQVLHHPEQQHSLEAEDTPPMGMEQQQFQDTEHVRRQSMKLEVLEEAGQEVSLGWEEPQLEEPGQEEELGWEEEQVARLQSELHVQLLAQVSN